MNKKNKVLITGSSGMIGTRLFEMLLQEGYEVTGFDRQRNHWVPSLNRLTVQGDLLHKQDLKKIPSKVDLFIHLAANARVHNLVLHPDLALENMITTHNVLESAREKAVKHVMFSGSREVYSNKQGAIRKEQEVNLHECESPYAASKMSNEAELYAFSKCYGVTYTVFRLSNVYGMYDVSDRFMPLMIRSMRKHKDVYIYGKNKVLDFTYIDDCVEGIIQGVKKLSAAKNETFNIASGEGVALVRVAQLIKDQLHSKSRIVIKPVRQGEVVQYVANIEKARKLLGYQPSLSLEDGLAKTIQWYSYGKSKPR